VEIAHHVIVDVNVFTQHVRRMAKENHGVTIKQFQRNQVNGLVLVEIGLAGVINRVSEIE
jgi:hypothetical protein